jgi:hypothetical protein
LPGKSGRQQTPKLWEHPHGSWPAYQSFWGFLVPNLSLSCCGAGHTTRGVFWV